MKKLINNLLKIFVIVLMVSFTYSAEAQPPSNPPDAGDLSSSNSQGGRAPIGGGLFILLGLGAAYGGRKLYQIRKENLEE